MLKGSKEVAAALNKRSKRVQKAIMSATFKAAVKVQNRARTKILKGPKSGRVYRKSKTVNHQASAPGEPPANDTGNLQSSIKVVKGEFVQGVANAEVQVSAKYAADLEFGTKKMEARPYLMPSFLELKDEIQKGLRDALAEANRG